MNPIHRILNYFFPYDPTRNCIALPETEKAEPVARKSKNERRGKTETVITSKTHQVFDVDPDGNEWKNRAYQGANSEGLNADPFLTDADVEQMRIKGILTDAKIRVAENIKPLFASGRSRSEIVEAFKGQRGYSDGSLAPLLACFAAAIEKPAQSCANN